MVPHSPLLYPRLFIAVSVGINRVNWQIVVSFRQFPAAILLAFEGNLILEKLLGDLSPMTGGGLVLIRNHDAVFPSSVFTSVKAWPIDGVGRYIAQFLLTVENGNLIFLKDLPELLGVSPFHLIDPLD